MPSVLIYGGEGAGKRSLHMAEKMLSSLLSHIYTICIVQTGQELKDALLASSSSSSSSIALIVFPGGADRPYQAALAGETNRLLHEYVERGGAYLGFCAGAYYACESIVFDGMGPLCVREDRELRFFPGQGVGPVFTGFEYNTQSGAFAVPVRLTSKADDGEEQQQQQQQHDAATTTVYFNGGCTFVGKMGDGVEVLATYEPLPGYTLDACVQSLAGADTHLPAIIKCRVGAGVAVLSGLHPEFNPLSLKELMGVKDEDLLHRTEGDSDKVVEGKKTSELRDLFGRMEQDEQRRVSLMKSLLRHLRLTVEQTKDAPL